jgi:hypothetical protein
MPNYRVTINPDVDFASDQIVNLLIDAKDIEDNPMDQRAIWFRTVEAAPVLGKNYRVMLDPLADLSNDQIVKLQIDAQDISGNPMDRQAVWFRTVELPLVPGKDYRVFIDLLDNFSDDQIVKLLINAQDINGNPMDQGAVWFRTIELPLPPGKNYRVFIDALHDLSNDEIVKLLINAKDDIGNPMDQQAIWFRTIAISLPEGKNYRVSIDPLHDLSRNQIVKLQVYAKDDENNPMDIALVWFRTNEFYPGYRIFINPGIDFEEMQTINLEILATNTNLLSMLEAFWFQTEHFDVLVNILPGYPDISLISKVLNFDTAIIKWETNKKVGAYQLEMGGNGKGTGIILGTVFGSQNVQGELPGVLELIETVIKGADLEAVSPGSGEKRINIYVTDSQGYTNPYEN